MNNSPENEQLADLVCQIKHVSLNQQDLIDVSLEYLTLYFQGNQGEQNKIEKFWDNPFFIEKVCLVSREAIILGMQAITLDKKHSFPSVVKACVDLEYEDFSEEQLTKNKKERQYIKGFLNYLRKELFNKIYYQNKKLQKSTKIPDSILNERYQYFVNYNFQ